MDGKADGIAEGPFDGMLLGLPDGEALGDKEGEIDKEGELVKGAGQYPQDLRQAVPTSLCKSQ